MPLTNLKDKTSINLQPPGLLRNTGTVNGGRSIWPADAFAPDVDTDACRLTNELPTCPHCGGLARPNILMFGDDGWIEQRQAQQMKRLQAWMARLERPLVIEIGAGTAIATLRHFSHEVLVSWGGRLIRINPTEPQAPTPRDVGLAAGALEALSAIDSIDASGSGLRT